MHTCHQLNPNPPAHQWGSPALPSTCVPLRSPVLPRLPGLRLRHQADSPSAGPRSEQGRQVPLPHHQDRAGAGAHRGCGDRLVAGTVMMRNGVQWQGHHGLTAQQQQGVQAGAYQRRATRSKPQGQHCSSGHATACSSYQQSALSALNAGCTLYVPRPVGSQGLALALQHLNSRPAAAPRSVRVGCLQPHTSLPSPPTNQPTPPPSTHTRR